MKLHAWLAGAWAGVLWFFTFGVAWNLFRLFPRERAGEVTTALFPTYFAVAIVLGGAATLAMLPSFPRSRGARLAVALQLFAIAALAATALILQPAMAAHAPGTPGFARLHGLSMALNLFSLLAVPAASLLVIKRRKERRNEG